MERGESGKQATAMGSHFKARAIETQSLGLTAHFFILTEQQWNGEGERKGERKGGEKMEGEGSGGFQGVPEGSI